MFMMISKDMVISLLITIAAPVLSSFLAAILVEKLTVILPEEFLLDLDNASMTYIERLCAQMMKYGLMFLYERDCGCFGGMLIVNAETDITCVFKKKQRREPTGLCVGYGNESSLTDDYTCLCLRLKVNIVVEGMILYWKITRTKFCFHPI